jgi:hypothetical protein
MRHAFALAALALAACTSSPQPACGRDCQIDAARQITMNGAIPSSARATQNGASGISWFTGATSIAIHGEYADGRDTAIIAGSGVSKDGKPTIFGLRVKLAGKTVSEVELLTAAPGEASLAPPAIPISRNALFDTPVDPAHRTPPAQMIAAANAYFDGIQNHDGAAVPVTDTCNRVENGVQTTHSPRFASAGCNSLEVFVYIPKVRDRRFPIVDEERGVVVGAVVFDIPGGDYKRTVNGAETTRHYDPRSILLFEAFKVVDGKIQQIEATMRNIPLGAKTGW